MRVKPARSVFRALKARDRKAQGDGRNAAEALGRNEDMKSPVGRHRTLVPPYRAQSPSYPVLPPQGSRARFRVLFHPGLCFIAPCMICVGTAFHLGKIPVIGAFSLLLSLCESMWKCGKLRVLAIINWLDPQRTTGGRKRSRLELRARAEGRSSARTPGSSRTGPRWLRADRRKGERPGCGITQGGLP